MKRQKKMYLMLKIGEVSGGSWCSPSLAASTPTQPITVIGNDFSPCLPPRRRAGATDAVLFGLTRFYKMLQFHSDTVLITTKRTLPIIITQYCLLAEL